MSRNRVGRVSALGAVLACGFASASFAQSTPSDFTSGVRYDLARRVVGTIAADPGGSGALHYAAVRNTYDAAGNLIRVEKGELSAWQSELVAPSAWSGFTIFQTVTTTFDVMDRKVSEALSSGGTTYSLTQTSYDGAGRLLCTAVRMNPAVYGSLPDACTLGTAGSNGPDRITRMTYDAAGQVLKVQKAYATPLQQDYATFTYSANGKQTSMTDANGNLAQMTYDGFDRQVRWTFPSPTTPGAVNASDYEGYTFDANGNRTSLRKRDGQTIGYAYDALNRMSVKDIPGGTAQDVYYGYDLRGLQSYARFGSTSGAGLTNGYDGFGRQTSASTNLDGTARTLAYQYDADGNRVRVTHPDGTYFATSFDGLDRPVAMFENGAAQVVSIGYDAQGRRVGEARGAVASGYGYDPVSRLASLSDDLAGTSADVSTTFGYNPANQIVTKTRSNTGYAFGGYTTGSTSYAVNGLNQYIGVGAGSLGYDANGNLTTTGGTTYGYDVENRLISASGTANAVLDYDPAGRLWRMTSAGSTVAFLYDGDQLLQERDGSGTLLRRYVHGAGEDDPLLWYEGAGLSDRRSLQVDHQGSIVSIANSDGSLRTVDSYDEYGVPGAGNDGRFQYTGQAWLPALGLYYYKARMYASRLGRFLQTDPIGYADQNNLYAYVANDPVNNVDHNGQEIGRAAKDLLVDPNKPQPKVDPAGALANIIDAVTIVAVAAETALSGGATLAGPDEAEIAGERALTATMRGASESCTGAASADSVVTRTTREGTRGAKITRSDGSIVDIKPNRVKEFTPVNNPKAPPGTMQRVKFEDALPGSKGYKRAPTSEELDHLKDR